MENTIILNTGQVIDVLFQDEVSIDIDCTLRYIKSGEQELYNYVQKTVKPQLNQVIIQAHADMETEISKGIAEAKSSASISAENTINSSITNAQNAIAEYTETSIKPELNTAIEQVTDILQQNKEIKNIIDESVSEVYASTDIASSLATEASASALLAQTEAAKASWGNIGDIKYTVRTDIPRGGVWCNGAKYSQNEFPEVYQMLLNGQLQTLPDAEFDAQVAEKGVCGYFGLDEENKKFSVPLLKDIYIKVGDNESFADFTSESLPNIRGTIGKYNAALIPIGGSVFTESSSGGSRFLSHSSDSPSQSLIQFDASRSSPAYQNEAKVNPDNITYRAYVVIYTSMAEPSELQAAEYIQRINTKADSDASNFTTEGKKLLSKLSTPSGCYLDLTLGVSGEVYTMPAGGYLHLFRDCSASGQYIAFINPKNFLHLGVNYGITALSGVALTQRVAKNEQIQVNYTASAPNYSMFYFEYDKGEQL